MAKDNGYEAVMVKNIPGEENELNYPTMWMLLTGPQNAQKLVDTYENAELYTGEYIIWTDQKNSVLDVLSFDGSGLYSE